MHVVPFGVMKSDRPERREGDLFPLNLPTTFLHFLLALWHLAQPLFLFNSVRVRIDE